MYKVSSSVSDLHFGSAPLFGSIVGCTVYTEQTDSQRFIRVLRRSFGKEIASPKAHQQFLADHSLYLKHEAEGQRNK